MLLRGSRPSRWQRTKCFGSSSLRMSHRQRAGPTVRRFADPSVGHDDPMQVMTAMARPRDVGRLIAVGSGVPDRLVPNWCVGVTVSANFC